MYNLLILLVITSSIVSQAQQLTKESNFYNSTDQLYRTERAYTIDQNSTLYCGYDGLTLSFKRVDIAEDTMTIYQSSEKVGDTSICFCLESEIRTKNKRSIKCIKENQTIYVEDIDAFSTDLIAQLKKKNLEVFQKYSSLNTVSNLNLAKSEQYIYQNDKLIAMHEFSENKVEKTTTIQYLSNTIQLKKTNILSNQVELENELIWENTGQNNVMKQNLFEISETNSQVYSKKLSFENELNSSLINIIHSPTPHDIMSEKLIAKYKYSSQDFKLSLKNELEDHHIELQVGLLKEQGTYTLIYHNPNTEKLIAKVVVEDKTLKGQTPIDSTVKLYASRLEIED